MLQNIGRRHWRTHMNEIILKIMRHVFEGLKTSKTQTGLLTSEAIYGLGMLAIASICIIFLG